MATSKWQWNGIDLWVNGEEITREIKRAELVPLDSTTSVYHFFGSASEHRALKCVVIGEANKDSIITDAIGDTSRTLVTPWGSVLSAKIDKVPKFSPKLYGGATIGGTTYTSDVTPIFDCELEIILP